MPGQAKIVSVTIANAMRPPNSTPTTVTIGIMMFLRTCTETMRRSDSPLARANFTKSSGIVLPHAAAGETDDERDLEQGKIEAGRMRWRQAGPGVEACRGFPRTMPTSPRPVDGSQPSQTEKIMISIMPCQKFGRLKPRIDPVMTVSSSSCAGPETSPQAERDAQNEREGKSHEGQLERRRHPVEDEIDGRLIEDEGTTEVALQGIPDEGAILFDERPVEPECPDRLFPFGRGRVSARSGYRSGLPIA